MDQLALLNIVLIITVSFKFFWGFHLIHSHLYTTVILVIFRGLMLSFQKCFLYFCDVTFTSGIKSFIDFLKITYTFSVEVFTTVQWVRL